jgi:hypothetical protein
MVVARMGNAQLFPSGLRKTLDGRARLLAVLEIAEGVVVAIRSILNPEKVARTASCRG